MIKAGWLLGLLGLAGGLTACSPTNSGYTYTPSTYTPSTYSAPTNSSSSDTSTRERRRTERTIVTDRGVTIIQRDPDGTRTIVTSGGYIRVDPPSPRRRH